MRKILLFLMLLIPYVSFSQPGGEEDVIDAPIDGGIIWLIIVIVVYTLKQFYKYRYNKMIKELEG